MSIFSDSEIPLSGPTKLGLKPGKGIKENWGSCDRLHLWAWAVLKEPVPAVGSLICLATAGTVEGGGEGLLAWVVSVAIAGVSLAWYSWEVGDRAEQARRERLADAAREELGDVAEVPGHNGDHTPGR